MKKHIIRNICTCSIAAMTIPLMIPGIATGMIAQAAEQTTEEATEETAESTGSIFTPKPISEEELAEIEESLQPYYGFFMSEYDDPTGIEWDQVFYNGGGIATSLTEDQELHMRANPKFYGGTDCTKIYGSDLRAYVLRTTGTDYSEAKYPLDWFYDEEYDFYYFSHGDTNGSSIRLSFAEKMGDRYYLYHGAPANSREKLLASDKDSLGRVEVAERTEDGWRFLSNTTVTKEFLQTSITPEIGSTVTFGHYEQDGDENNGAEAIEWRVLAVEDGKVLVISENEIEESAFSEDKYTDSTWDTSWLRGWLNGEFAEEAFEQEELAQIAITSLPAEARIHKTMNQGADSEDRIFLLSASEVETYFPEPEDRTSERVQALNQSKFSMFLTDQPWILRTVGEWGKVAMVDRDGTINLSGKKQYGKCYIRPAAWVYIDPENTETPEKETSESETYEPEVQAYDTIEFGQYGGNPIKWRILKSEGDHMLVISDRVLDKHAYDEEKSDVTWETSDIRAWLNGEFVEDTFSEEEAARIETTVVPADVNESYSTSAGNATEDKVFLLSLPEVETYFTSDADRIAAASEYALMQKVSTQADQANAYWWLRSPGAEPACAAFVNTQGGVIYMGDLVTYETLGVRPAMWIKN